MANDPAIVEEVRRRRSELSARFDDDIERYGQHLMELQQQYKDRIVDQVTVVSAGKHEKRAYVRSRPVQPRDD